MKTIAIIPVYDEEVAIGSIVLKAKNHVDEVVVVDDGSTDRTAEIAALAGAKVLRHEANRGKGIALRTALDYARMNGAGAAVLLDGDGQHNPDDIPTVLEPVLSGQSDLVIGLRHRGTTKMPLYRRIGKRVLDYATAASGGGVLTDSQSGFRALSRAAINSLTLTEEGFAVESEMLVEAKEKNLKVAEVPVAVRYDVGESTKGPVRHGFGVVDHILRIVAVRHPLLFFGVSGLVLFATGILIGLIALNTYRTAPELAIGYSFLVVIFLIIGGLAMFAGVMLNVMPKVLTRSMDQNNGKP